MNNNAALQTYVTATGTWCKFIGIAPVFDSENNMQTTATPVSTRNATTEARGSNGVHPAIYYQISDAVWRDFIRNFCYI